MRLTFGTHNELHCVTLLKAFVLVSQGDIQICTKICLPSSERLVPSTKMLSVSSCNLLIISLIIIRKIVYLSCLTILMKLVHEAVL